MCRARRRHACGYVRAAARCPGTRRPGAELLAGLAVAGARARPPCGAARPPGRPLSRHSPDGSTGLADAASQASSSLFQGAMCQRGCLLPFPRPNPSIHLSIHHPRPPSVSSNVNPRTRPVALVPSSPHPAKQKSMDHGVLPLPYPTLPSLLFLLASHRHRDAKGRAGHAAAPWHTTRRER